MEADCQAALLAGIVLHGCGRNGKHRRHGRQPKLWVMFPQPHGYAILVPSLAFINIQSCGLLVIFQDDIFLMIIGHMGQACVPPVGPLCHLSLSLSPVILQLSSGQFVSVYDVNDMKACLLFVGGPLIFTKVTRKASLLAGVVAVPPTEAGHYYLTHLCLSLGANAVINHPWLHLYIIDILTFIIYVFMLFYYISNEI